MAKSWMNSPKNSYKMKDKVYLRLRETPGSCECNNAYSCEIFLSHRDKNFFSNSYSGKLNFKKIANDIAMSMVRYGEDSAELIIPFWEHEILDGIEDILRETLPNRVTRESPHDDHVYKILRKRK